MSDNLIRFSKGTDLLIHEVAWAKPELQRKSEAARIIIGLHMTPEEAGTVFARVKPRLAVYSHVVLVTTDPAFTEPTSADVPKTYAKNLRRSARNGRRPDDNRCRRQDRGAPSCITRAIIRSGQESLNRSSDRTPRRLSSRSHP